MKVLIRWNLFGLWSEQATTMNVMNQRKKCRQKPKFKKKTLVSYDLDFCSWKFVVGNLLA